MASTTLRKAGTPVRPAIRTLTQRLLQRGPVSWIEILGLAVVCAAAIVAVAWAWRVPLLLGHDESVYAVMARHWQDGTPDTGVADHRAPLLPALGVPVLALGGGDLGLRLLGLAALIGSGVAVWCLARTLAGPIAGLVASSVFMFAHTVFRAGTSYLTDLPAAGLLIALAALLWTQFGLRSAPDYRLLLLGPLAWGAYEFRYGSALVVVLLLASTAVMFWPTVRSNARLVIASVGGLVALLIPHFINSTLDLGTPWARLLYTTTLSGREYLGEGLLDYLRWFPRELAGSLAAALMVVGLVGSVILVLLKGRAQTTDAKKLLAKGLLFFTIPGVGHLVAIGIASHGEPRFVFFTVGLLCATGAAIVAVALDEVLARSSPMVWFAVLAFACVMATQIALLARAESRARDRGQREDQLILVATDALRERAGPDCSVLTTYTPQITWYSGCASYHFSRPPIGGRQQYLTEDGWMLLFNPGKRQPQGELLDTYLDIAEEQASWDAPVDGEFMGATLYQVTSEES